LQLVQGLPVEHELAKLVADAKLTSPVLISTEQASSMVRRYAWLLERVGDTGIKLSAAGYLPVADVTAAMVELEMTDEWYGKFNRESQTLPSARTARPTKRVLAHMGALGERHPIRSATLPTSGGAALARASLQRAR
jgi:hypothetical protein